MISVLRGWFIEQLAMYSAYHRDRRNQITHHVGVPVIVFALLLALSQVSVAEVGGIRVAADMLVLAVLLLFYMSVLPLIGLVTALFYSLIFFVVERVARESATTVWSVAASAFIGGWVIQFIGHAFEGRRPALTVNALQIFMAPPFLIAEVLFGLGLEKKLARELDSRAAKFLATVSPARK